MRTRLVLAAAALAPLLLVGCSGGTESPTPAPVETAEQEPAVEPEQSPSPTATEAGPSREGLVKAIADWWGEASEQERIETCDAIDETTGGGMWEALGSPESISETEIDLIMADYCRDY